MGSAEIQKESDACIKMVDKIVVIDSNLQVEFGRFSVSLSSRD